MRSDVPLSDVMEWTARLKYGSHWRQTLWPQPWHTIRLAGDTPPLVSQTHRIELVIASWDSGAIFSRKTLAASPSAPALPFLPLAELLAVSTSMASSSSSSSSSLTFWSLSLGRRYLGRR